MYNKNSRKLIDVSWEIVAKYKKKNILATFFAFSKH